MIMETREGIPPPPLDVTGRQCFLIRKMHMTAPEIMEEDNVIIQHGQYKTISTLAEYLPAESEQGYIRIVKPLSWGRKEPEHTPMVLLLPGTGEKGYGRRYDGVALPLARLGVGSIVVLRCVRMICRSWKDRSTACGDQRDKMAASCVMSPIFRC